MFTFKSFLSLAAGMLITLNAQAGSKGFTVVFIEIGDSNFFESNVYKAFSTEYPDSKERRACWDGRATGGKSFELIIKKAIPNGLTRDVAKSIWEGSREQTKLAQRVIAKAKSPKSQSIDGLYVINAQDGRISIMALGSRTPIGKRNPSQKLTISWDELHPQQAALAFDMALCKISHPLDFGFSP
jgi:hypothetical protein